MLDVNVFALTMELRVTTWCNSAMILFMGFEWFLVVELQFIKEHLVPHDVSGGMTNHSILSLKCG